MIYKSFQDISLSRLGMGNMRLPIQNDVEGKPIDREKAREIIDLAMKSGINYYDTAYMYHGGESEKFLGDELVSRYPRDSFYIATKYIRFANKDYRAVFEEQLSRLKTDRVDFYLIHAVGDDSCDDYLDCGCIDYFLEQQKNGRIKYFGFSSHASPDTLRRFASHHKWDFAQIQLNYFDWIYGSAKAEYQILEELDIPVVVMEPVRGGKLAALSDEAKALISDMHPDWSDASWAFRFVKSLPQVQIVLSGMSTLDQMTENLATFSDEIALTATETSALLEACKVFHSQLQVPCTACRYCCDGCPVDIDIPAVLNIYNKYKLDGAWALEQLDSLPGGKPVDCISCEACKSHCPQSIDITAIMQELASVKRG